MAADKKPPRKKLTPAGRETSAGWNSQALLAELRGLIDAARQHVAQTANATLTMLYWRIGQRIRREVLNDQRAEYGQEILPTLSAKLVRDYGTGFGAKNLARMIQFHEIFPDEEIVVSLSRQLSWTHFIALIPLKQPLEREFYAEMCRVERWSVRTLRERIASQMYLRTALAKQPEAVVKAEIGHLRAGGQMTPDQLRAATRRRGAHRPDSVRQRQPGRDRSAATGWLQHPRGRVSHRTAGARCPARLLASSYRTGTPTSRTPDATVLDPRSRGTPGNAQA